MENGTEKKSKKRRREEASVIGDSQDTTIETAPAKKHKKSKKDHAAVLVKQESPLDEHAGPIQPTLPPVKEKSKKRKLKPQDHVTTTDEAAVAAVAAPAPDATLGMLPRASPELATTKKKSKKVKAERRDSAEEVAAVPNGVPRTELDEPIVPNGTSEQTKEKKKKRSESEAVLPEANGVVHVDEPPAPSATIEAPVEEVSTTITAIDEKLLESKSPFRQQTASFYLALSPIAHHFPVEGLCAEHISPLLLTYYPPLKGIVLSFSNPRMSETPEQGQQTNGTGPRPVVLGESIDEYAVIFVWLTVDVLLFRPQKNTVLEGFVNLQNESMLGLICYNYFNAGIERSRLPKDWRWVEDESAADDAGAMARRGRRSAAGYYVDGNGKKVEGRVVFRVKDFEASPGSETGGGSINIYGTALSTQEDDKIDEDLRSKALVKDK
ncbi:hypothetical protein B0A48_03523 [Cryoendolithus antarcticus]|uniref:DNA-directed RNA polymerase subunit n=1 Tax=Cryoendolithus antarcticus TaxID=1507870 RepID=A0A1V8TK90_9PEZI|nr:hypothetical protein B0A48_03523 [Cryoendolithus antarcticus]